VRLREIATGDLDGDGFRDELVSRLIMTALRFARRSAWLHYAQTGAITDTSERTWRRSEICRNRPFLAAR